MTSIIIPPEVHAVRMWTFHSENSDPGKEWLAYLILPAGRLPLAFFAPTEAAALKLATDEWDSHRDEREANYRRREENKLKAQERKAAKAVPA